MKYTKSLCMGRDAWEILEALQKRTRKSMSQTLEILINQWLKMQQEHNVIKKEIEQQANRQIADYKRAKVVR